MRKLIVTTMITLDGVMQAPGGPEEDTSSGFKYGGWTAPLLDEVGGKVFAKLMKPADYLLGRKTFDIFASYWPEHADVWPGINNGTKYVMSTAMKKSDWKNTVFLESLADIKKLINSEGSDIQVWGSGKVVQLLLKNDLVDELWLSIFPLTLGQGQKLFEDGTIPSAFTLIESIVTPSGVIIANYKRAGKVKTGTVGSGYEIYLATLGCKFKGLMNKRLDDMKIEELGDLFPVIISEPDYNWIMLYQKEETKIKKVLGKQNVIRIEHIGSTAIPNLKAKPTIDILLEVPGSIDKELVIEKLKKLDYHYIPRPENPAPHMMFAKGYTPNGFKGQAYHIHVRYSGDWDELYFRDYLKLHPEIASEYGELKARLCLEYKNNREEYTNKKTDFIMRITKIARSEKLI